MFNINVFILFILMDLSNSSHFYKLGKDLNSSFSLDSKTNVCDNFVEWILVNSGKKGDSAYYLIPSNIPSCIAFSFKSAPRGFIEIKQIFESVSLNDRVEITVYAEKTTEDAIIGKANISSSNEIFFNGSQIIAVFAGCDSQKGYVRH